MKEAGHPSGRTIYFEPEKHIYFSDRQDVFTSVTKFLDGFFPDFDKERISARYAEKNDMDQAEVLRVWEEKGRIARENGTMVHAFLEDLFYHHMKKGEFPEVISARENAKVRQMQRQALRMFNDILEIGHEMVESEMIIADMGHLVCGTADLITRKMEDPSHYYLIDYKTSEFIKRENKWQSGLNPVAHLPHCNFYHYALQLNIYKNMLITQGYFPEMREMSLMIAHVTDEGYTLIEDIPDYQKEVGWMFALGSS